MTDVIAQPATYQGEERRKSISAEMLELIKEIRENQKTIAADQAAMDAKLETHMKEETTELAQEIARLMMNAFPGGDPHGHRAAHQAWIRREEERSEFWRTMRKELGKWGLIGFMGFAVAALWNAFLQGPHK